MDLNYIQKIKSKLGEHLYVVNKGYNNLTTKEKVFTLIIIVGIVILLLTIILIIIAIVITLLPIILFVLIAISFAIYSVLEDGNLLTSFFYLFI